MPRYGPLRWTAPNGDGHMGGSRVAGLALGCTAVLAWAGDAQAQVQAQVAAACSAGAPALTIYHAGGLTAEFTAAEAAFSKQTGTCITDLAAGSLDAVRRIASGQQQADIFAAADYLDIELLLKPSRYATWDIVFARSEMVLAYTTASRNAGTVAGTEAVFSPPGSVPTVAADWASQLTQAEVVIGGSNPFLDPSGYRADMIFQLAAQRYAAPGLYNTFLEHYAITRPADSLGVTYDYTFTYASSALAAYKANPATYRFAKLPPALGLSAPGQERHYNQVMTVVPGLGVADSPAHIAIPGTRVTFGLTIPTVATHRATAIAFLQFLFGAQGIALQAADGPAPLDPPVVSVLDYERLPAGLRPLVSIQ